MKFKPIKIISFFFKTTEINVDLLGLGLWCSRSLSILFQLYRIVEVSFIGGGNWSTLRKPSTCRKSLTNFNTNNACQKRELHSTTCRMFVNLASIPHASNWSYTTVVWYLPCCMAQRTGEWQTDQQKLSNLHTKSLRRILRVFWPNKISNQHLLSRCNQEKMNTIIKTRRWRWIGHVLRKDQQDLTKTAFFWTPEGKQRSGRPRIT